MQMCNIQLATCKCATYNVPDSVVLLPSVQHGFVEPPSGGMLFNGRVVQPLGTAVQRWAAPPALQSEHGMAASTHGMARSAICGRRRALRCVSATIMARVSAWIVRSLAAVQYSQCHSLRILHRCSPPLCSARGSSCRHCRRTIEVNIRNQSHSNVYLLQVSRTAQCRRHMQPSHQ